MNKWPAGFVTSGWPDLGGLSRLNPNRYLRLLKNKFQVNAELASPVLDRLSRPLKVTTTWLAGGHLHKIARIKNRVGS